MQFQTINNSFRKSEFDRDCKDIVSNLCAQSDKANDWWINNIL